MAVELDTQPLTTFSKVDVNAVLKEVEEDEAAAKQPVESGMPGMPGMGGMGGMGGFDPAMMGMGGMDGMPDFSSMPGMDLPGLTGNPVGLPDAPDEAALVDELDTEIDVSGGKGLVTKRILVRGRWVTRPSRDCLTAD